MPSGGMEWKCVWNQIGKEVKVGVRQNPKREGKMELSAQSCHLKQ